MYYLNSRVICDESPDCMGKYPDIIIPRKYIMTEKFAVSASNYLINHKCKEIFLPIVDYPSNNIPKLSLSLGHIFKTPLTNNKNEMVVLFVKE